MVCWSTLETLACISQVLRKVRIGYPVLSLPHIHSSCMYFTFQSHFPLWCSNRIQAFNQLFKRWLLSTLCRISTVHPQTEMMVSLSSIMLMLVSCSSFALLTAYYPQHPPKETRAKSLRTLHDQYTFCFCFALPLLVTRNSSTTLWGTRQILRLMFGPGSFKQEELMIGDDGIGGGDPWSYLWSTSRQSLQHSSLPSSASQLTLHYTSWRLGNEKSQAWNLTASLRQTLKELLMWVVKPQ